MASLPLFSVIIPTHNRASLIGKTLESVFAQSCSDFEIIVIDDGSKDRTAEVVHDYEIEYGNRVRYYWQENQGKSVALNNALTHARGELIAFLDSDDIWLSDKLEWHLRAIAKFGSQYPCFTDATYTNNPYLRMTAFAFADKSYTEELGIISDPTALFLSTRSGVYIQTIVIRRDMAERVGNFDPELWVGNDTDYLFRLALTGPFCYVNRPLVEIDRTMNRNDGLIEKITKDEYLRLREHEHMYEKWLTLTQTRVPSIREQLLERLAETHNDWANFHLQNCEYREARKAMTKAIATQPTIKSAAKLLLATIAAPIARKEFLRRDSERSKHRVIA